MSGTGPITSRISRRCAGGWAGRISLKLASSDSFKPKNRSRWKSKTSTGNPKHPLQNKISGRFSRFPAELEIFCWRIKSSDGKIKNLQENRFSTGKNKSFAAKAKNQREISFSSGSLSRRCAAKLPLKGIGPIQNWSDSHFFRERLHSC